MKKENDLLEETLSIAENGYAVAYQFLLEEYEKNPENYGPQTLYFLACLAGGDNLPEKALEWLTVAILEKGWWYRPEVLEDDDLASLKNNFAFISLKSVSDNRYADAASRAKAVFTWERKNADKLFLAVHGNTQNGQIARDDWEPILRDNAQWQLETIQSAEPDGYGTYRWSYDMVSYVPVAKAIEKVQNEGYQKIVCGGFSAGCDMLLRAIIFTPARCDMLILQSPWIPILKDHAEDLVNAAKQKNIELKIFCGACDEDCLPMAKQLYEITNREGIHVEFAVQEGSRHQFPKELFGLKDSL
ncbi:MAG: hypothetical protein HDR18_12035 [Lachnospiraceae bacterium]|nr:hypothetical protein [Lachnospiraceae bacterium]